MVEDKRKVTRELAASNRHGEPVKVPAGAIIDNFQGSVGDENALMEFDYDGAPLTVRWFEIYQRSMPV
jgi:hypothetical protein